MRGMMRLALLGVPGAQIGGSVPFGEGGTVYGVSWDGGADPTLTRTDDAVGMVANAGVDMTPVDNDFDTADIYKDITEVTDALGNVFVRIPKFYIEKTANGAARTWRISKTGPGSTGYLPACFWDFTNNRALDYVDVGKYPASLSGDSKLESKPGVYPLISQNIVQFRGYAQANGPGYQQLDIHVVDALQTLFIVEFATLHSQGVMAGYTSGRYTATELATVTESNTNRIVVANATAALYRIGQAISVGTTQGGNQVFYGRTIEDIVPYDGSNMAIEFDGDPVDITAGNLLYNTAWRNDFSGWIAASSGSLVSNSDGKYPMMYRGIENLWGNVYQFVDGVNINDWQAWVCRDASQYASNLFAAPYEQLSYANHDANGYAVEMGQDPDRPFAELPVAIDASAVNSAYKDYYYQASGQRIALWGGCWNSGARAGLSCWYLSSSSSYACVVLGGRLLKKAL